MSTPLYRQKSLTRLSAPDQLHDYLHVTGPGIWSVLISVLLVLAALLAWSALASVESRMPGTARAENGVLMIWLEEDAGDVEVGMHVTVGELKSTIRAENASAALPKSFA